MPKPDVRLTKDFGGLVGGFPGGEAGLQSFLDTGVVVQNDAPTVGWGPPLVLLATGAAIAAQTGAVDPTIVGAKLSEATDVASTQLSVPEVDVPPQVGQYLATAAGVLVAGSVAVSAARSAVSGAAAVLSKSGRVAALFAASTLVGLKVLDII